jgi:hypothetical protein
MDIVLNKIEILLMGKDSTDYIEDPAHNNTAEAIAFLAKQDQAEKVNPFVEEGEQP